MFSPQGSFSARKKSPCHQEGHGLAAGLIGSHRTNSPTRNFLFGAEPVV